MGYADEFAQNRAGGWNRPGLGLINHGAALLSGQFTSGELVPLLVTYLVPFAVATYGQIQGKRQRDQAHQKHLPSAEIQVKEEKAP